VDKLGRAIESTQKAYDELTSTRTNQLQRPLDKIDELRQQRQLPEP